MADLNKVAGLPTLRQAAIAGTIFEGRLHDGRNSGTGETAGEALDEAGQGVGKVVEDTGRTVNGLLP